MKERMIREIKQNMSIHKQEFHLDLSGRWKFYLGAFENAVFSKETVMLPGSLDENHKGFPNEKNITLRNLNRDYVYTGPACYQKEFYVPQEWENRTIFFEMERTKKTRVWLDGQTVGKKQKSYTTPHRYDLTGLCTGGQHTLTVEVDNSEAEMPHAMYSTLLEGEAWCHQVSDFTQTNWNGIIGSITLTAFPELYLESIRLRPDIKHNRVLITTVLCRKDSEVGLHSIAEIRTESCQSSALGNEPRPMWQEFCFHPGETHCVLHAEYDMGENPLLWDEFNPNLYRLLITAYFNQDGQIYSVSKSEKFGMRNFTTDESNGGKQFYINGRPTILRGEINCAVFPKTGYPPMKVEDWRRIYKIYRSYGLNHVRFHTWVPPHAAFEAADQLGFYVYAELPQWGRWMFGNVYEGDETDANYYKEDARSIFAEYGNSPSFVMFALGNEERIGFYYYEEFLQYCKQLEPNLLYSDIAGHSTYPPSADFAAKFLDPEYLPMVNGSNDWDYGETVKKAPVAITSHEVGQLQVYPDYERELPQYETAVVKPRNLQEFQKILVQAGLADRDADFCRATGKLAAMLYRSFTESYLRTPGCGGFTLLGLQDFPGQGTALIGLLNAFLESKGAVQPEVFRQSCCELPVMARLSRFVWTEGEVLEAKIQTANYTAQDAQTAVEWILEDDAGLIVRKGRLEQTRLPQGKVTDCGWIRTLLPREQKARHLTLRLCLDGQYCAPNAPGVNDYDLWVYSEKGSTELPKNTVLARSFNQEARLALEEGKTVLLISEGNSKALPISREVTFRPDFWSPMFHTDRPDGYSLGIWVEKEHPIFKNFPTEEFGNWQWYHILQNARCILINDLPVQLRPIVQPIATIDLPDRLALLMEGRVGRGRIFISSVDLLNHHDAASQQLFGAICSYLGSESFEPQIQFTPDQLTRLLPPLDILGITLDIKHDLHSGEKVQAAIHYQNSSGECAAPEKATVYFASSDPQKISVSENGTVEAVTAGIAKITACCRYGGTEFVAEAIVQAAAKQVHPISMEGAKITASSELAGRPATELLNRNGDGWWQSDYLDRTQQMPQWVLIELPEQTTITAVLCHAWTGHPRGTILKANISLSIDGTNFEDVCDREWGIETVGQNRLFSFAPHSARFIRLTIKWAMMFTGDANAATIPAISLWQEPIVSDIATGKSVSVRFGTTLEQAMSALNLPKQTEIILSDGETHIGDIIWSCTDYCGEIPKEYFVTGEVYAADIANPARVTAKRSVHVLPKDLTTPPDKRAFYQALELLQQKAKIRKDSQLDDLLEKAESFHALTGAVQHDVDVWTEKLQEYQ